VRKAESGPSISCSGKALIPDIHAKYIVAESRIDSDVGGWHDSSITGGYIIPAQDKSRAVSESVHRLPVSNSRRRLGRPTWSQAQAMHS
jgi:hypothetical protein